MSSAPPRRSCTRAVRFGRRRDRSSAMNVRAATTVRYRCTVSGSADRVATPTVSRAAARAARVAGARRAHDKLGKLSGKGTSAPAPRIAVAR